MSYPKDGGPAFAAANVSDYEPGMSLRDYFAGQALAGICTSCGFQGDPWDSIATHAYLAADAMLAERAKAASP